ncbi:MAG: hypothetical protein Tsb007_35490 [Rhizobacter sp.]
MNIALRVRTSLGSLMPILAGGVFESFFSGVVAVATGGSTAGRGLGAAACLEAQPASPAAVARANTEKGSSFMSQA